MGCLVTGGAGFIGSTLVDRLLQEGNQVDVIDDLSSGRLDNLEGAQATGRLVVHQLDIRDVEAVEVIEGMKPDVIYHLAAQADVRRSVADPVFDASINILGTLNVLEGARRAGARRVIAAASGGTLYGEPPPSAIPTKEAFAHQPHSPYGVSKKSMIDYLVAYQKLHGIDYVALALANVYGPRQDPHGEAGVVAIFAEKLLNGEPVTIYGDGDQTRDFVFVEDVVEAFARAAVHGGNQVINIGTGRELSVNDLYRTMVSVTGEQAPAFFAPPRTGELQRSCLDVTRAASELDWVSWTSFEEGATTTIEAVRRRLASN